MLTSETVELFLFSKRLMLALCIGVQQHATQLGVIGWEMSAISATNLVRCEPYCVRNKRHFIGHSAESWLGGSATCTHQQLWCSIHQGHVPARSTTFSCLQILWICQWRYCIQSWSHCIFTNNFSGMKHTRILFPNFRIECAGMGYLKIVCMLNIYDF